jgi:quercetin dioxygenase-like cupin family protein
MAEKGIQDAVKLRYAHMGLKPEVLNDEEGKVWGPHTHEETYIFVLDGELKVKLDQGNWLTLEPSDELFIEKDQIHETKAQKGGCKYIVAS